MPIIFDCEILGKVKNDTVGLNLVFFNFFAFFLHFVFGPTDHANVEALSGQLMANFKSNAVGASSDDRERIFSRVAIIEIVLAPEHMSIQSTEQAHCRL